MHRIALVFIAGCAGNAHPSADGPVHNATMTTTDGVLVRFANKGEFPRSPRNQSEGRRMNRLGNDCHLSGPSTRSYVQPVVAFARAHLAEGHRGDQVHDFFIAHGEKPTLGDGVNILVELHPVAGELTVLQVGPPFYAPGTAWAGRTYCLHVLHNDGETTIVVDPSGRWIK